MELFKWCYILWHHHVLLDFTESRKEQYNRSIIVDKNIKIHTMFFGAVGVLAVWVHTVIYGTTSAVSVLEDWWWSGEWHSILTSWIFTTEDSVVAWQPSARLHFKQHAVVNRGSFQPTDLLDHIGMESEDWSCHWPLQQRNRDVVLHFYWAALCSVWIIIISNWHKFPHPVESVIDSVGIAEEFESKITVEKYCIHLSAVWKC